MRMSIAIAIALLCLSNGQGAIGKTEIKTLNGETSMGTSGDTSRQATWISSAMPRGGSLRIARTTSDGEKSEITYLTDSPYNDYKPVISTDGTKVVFFRAYQENPDFFLWESTVCVMDIDGGNLRELTDHTFFNTEPYWTRDGTNRVTWSRMIHRSKGEMGTYVYSTAADAKPGDEQQISATGEEWSNSSLKDGRVFVKKASEGYYLLTPNPGGEPSYDLISYPDSFHYLHKGSISNDETMIAYMKYIGPNRDTYLGAEIVYADFDPAIPAITNEYAFVPLDETKFSWYVSISPDNKHLIYAENGKIMEHDVDARKTRQLSTLSDVEYRYPTYIGTTK